MVLGFSTAYSLLLGIMMILGTQSVTPTFYWLIMLIAGLGVAYPVIIKIWPTRIPRHGNFSASPVHFIALAKAGRFKADD